ncbi:peptidase S53, partial [Burkholderia thailandensis]|nr:peptidase S53 [Burkholderia thailandensis]
PATSPYVVAVGATTLSPGTTPLASPGQVGCYGGLQPIGLYDSYGSYDGTQRLCATDCGYSKNKAVRAWTLSVVVATTSTRAPSVGVLE